MAACMRTKSVPLRNPSPLVIPVGAFEYALSSVPGTVNPIPVLLELAILEIAKSDAESEAV